LFVLRSVVPARFGLAHEVCAMQMQLARHKQGLSTFFSTSSLNILTGFVVCLESDNLLSRPAHRSKSAVEIVTTDSSAGAAGCVHLMMSQRMRPIP
jgi:hypothetical protein